MVQCFEALTRETVPREPLGTLLVAELPAAVKNGLVAAAVVAAVLAWQGGIDAGLLVAIALAAVPLAVAIHLPVLAVGVAIRRGVEGPRSTDRVA